MLLASLLVVVSIGVLAPQLAEAQTTSTVSVSTHSLTDNEGGGASGSFRVSVSPVTQNVPLRLCFKSSLADSSFVVSINSSNISLGNDGCIDRIVTAKVSSIVPNIVWNQRLDIQLDGNSDSVDEPDEIVTLTVSEDPDNQLPAGVSINTDASSSSITIRDDDPTLVTLTGSAISAIREGRSVEFSVSLSRPLVAGEIVDVPLAVSGDSSNVRTDDWSLTLASGAGVNKGVTLSGESTTTPKISFAGAGVQTATLVLSALLNIDTGTETLTVGLGPNGMGVNGFDRLALATNLGGGADPSSSTSSFSVTVNDPVAPAAPKGLVAVAGDEQISMTWNNPGNALITGYEFRRARGPSFSWGSPKGIVYADASTVSYVGTSLVNGTAYRFQIRAVSGGVAGAWSESVEATPAASSKAPPAAPTNLSIRSGAGEVTLVWDQSNNTAITGYQFRQRAGTLANWSDWFMVSNSSYTTTTHKVMSLSNNTVYSFQVRAVSGTVNGVASVVVRAIFYNETRNLRLTVLVDDSTVVEGTDAVLRVRLSYPIVYDVRVQLKTIDGTATFGADYGRSSNSADGYWLTIEAGSLEGTVTVPVLADAVDDEPPETFRVYLSSLSFRNPGSNVDVQDIRKFNEIFGEISTLAEVIDGQLPDVQIIDGLALAVKPKRTHITEGQVVELEAVLTQPAQRDVSFRWFTRDGGVNTADSYTAKAGADYTARAAEQVTIPAGTTSVVLASVKTLQDNIDESEQYFRVVFDQVSGAASDDSQIVLTIVDDDARPEMSISDASATEGSDLSFVISLSAVSERPVSVVWVTEDDTAQSVALERDYLAVDRRRTITFTPGDTKKTITVSSIDDSQPELTERFFVQLAHVSNAKLIDTTAEGTIQDNEKPQISIADADPRVNEGYSSVANFVVTLIPAQTVPVTIQLQTLEGLGNSQGNTFHDAQSGGNHIFGLNDFVSRASASLLFAPGETKKTFQVKILKDAYAEAIETFRVQITKVPDGFNLVRATAFAEIDDDDAGRLKVASLLPSSVVEGNSGMKRYRAVLRRTVPGFDLYIQQQGLSIKKEGAKVRFAICPYREDSELIAQEILPAGALPTEADGDEFSYGIRSNIGFLGSTTCRAPESDFLQASFGGGEYALNVNLSILGDTKPEENERVVLWVPYLSQSPFGHLDPTQKGLLVHTVIVDDERPQASISGTSVYANNGNAQLRVTLNKSSSQPLTVSYQTQPLDAKPGFDYTTVTGEVTFAPGETSKTISVPISVNIESTKRFKVLLKKKSTDVNVHPDHAEAIVTVYDISVPDLIIPDRVIDEGDAKQVLFSLSDRQPNDAGRNVVLDWYDGSLFLAYSAISGVDYKPITGNTEAGRITIRAGETGFSRTLTTIEDSVVEPDEDIGLTVKLSESGTGNFSIIPTYFGRRHQSDGSGRMPLITIRDDDSYAPISLTGYTDDSVGAGAVWTSPTPIVSGGGPYRIGWTLEGDDADDFTIDYETGVVTLPPQVFNQPADSDSDNVYAVTVRVTNEDGATTTQDFSVTVQKRSLILSKNSITLPEKDGTATYTVVLNSKPVTDVEVAITVSGDTEAVTLDKSELTFTPEDWDKPQEITVTTVDDALDNPDDLRTVTITHAANSSGFEPADTYEIAVEITDDDDPPTVQVGDATAVVEGDDPNTTVDMSFTVTLSAVSAKPVTVEYTLSGTASGGADYTAPDPLSVEIPVGATTATIIVKVKGDIVAEGNETVIVALGSPTNATISTADSAGTGTGTITDNDAAPTTVTLTADPDMVAESADKTSVTVTAMLGGTTTRSVATAVTVSVGGGTATVPADYAAVKDFTITIAAGTASATGTFDLIPVDDSVDEPAETVEVTGTVSGGGFTVTKDTVMITDDDAAPTAITLTADPDTVLESADKTEITVTAMLGGTTTRSVATVVTVSVGGGTASSPADYAAVEDFTITIPAGQKSATGTFDFTPANDKIDEPAETVDVTGKASGFTVTGDTITITDDDAAPTAITLTADPDTVAEEGGKKTVTVTATLGGTTTSSTATVVTVSVGGGTASSPADYAAVEAFTITIPAGQQSATGTFDLTPADDKIDEPNETVDVTGVVTGGGFTVAKDVVTITDDDATPSAVTLTAAPDSVAESADTAEITVTAVLGGTTTRSVATEVTVSVGGGTASSPADYAVVEDFTITIPAGQKSATNTFDFTPVDDSVDEPAETVEVTGKAGTLTVTKDVISITDDDAAPTAITLTADPDTVAEEGGKKTVTVTATLGGTTTSSTATEITVSVGGGTATVTDDYAAVSNFTITIPAGNASATATFDFTPADDKIDEPNETVEVTGKAGTLTVTKDVISITDDDAAPTAITLTADPDTVAEEGGKKTVTVTATLGGTTTSSTATEITVSVGGGTASSPADYAAVEDFTITIAAGASEAEGTFDLIPVDDSVDEPNETVDVTGKAGTLSVTGDEITITDDDATPTAITLVAAPDSVGEGADKTEVTVTATLGGSTTRSVATEVTVSVGGGTATSVADYAAIEDFTITIPAGQKSATATFDLTPVDDSVDEPNETVEVSGKASGFTVTGDTITITDNDAAPTAITLTAAPDTVAEEGGKTKVTVTATLGGTTTSSTATAITVSVGGGTATSVADYAAIEDFTITIPAGQKSATATFDLTPVDDSVDEPNETVEVSGKASGFTVTGDTITITDNDAAPTAITLTAAPDTVAEEGGKTKVTVTATLGGTTTSSTATAITVSVGGGTATSVADYAAVEAFTITIPAGQQSATGTFDFTPVDDSVDEPNETVEVTGKSGTLTVTGDVVTITDNDAAPTTVTLTADPDMVAEGDGKTSVTVTAMLGGTTTRSVATVVTVSVGGGTATSVADYAAVKDFTITIPAGAVSATGTFDLIPVDDSVDEPAETVEVSGKAGTLSVTGDEITITDDDATPTAITLVAAPDSVGEGADKTEVTVTATLGGTTTSSTATEVTVSVGGGTATSVADYAAIEDFTITIPAGQKSATATFDLTPVDDSVDEPNETVEVSGKASGFTVTGDTITITDNDAAPTAITLTAAPDTVAEEGGKTKVTVTATLGGTTTSSTATAITVSVGGGTATSVADYAAVEAFTITIPAGQQSATGTFDFTPVDDSVDEPNETVEVTGKSGTLTVTGDVVTITDNDAAPTTVTLTADPDMVAESADKTSVTVTATLGGTTTRSVATVVTVSVGGGTATETADYAAVKAFTITIPAGASEAEGTFDFTPVDDKIDEPAETVDVTGKAGTLSVTGDVVTITDDDATPTAVTLTAAPDSVAESAGETEVTVTAMLGGSTTRSVATEVTVSVGGGTATETADYAVVEAFTITIPAGQQSATGTFDLTPADDKIDEPNETVDVTGVVTGGGFTVAKDVVTITDDDATPSAVTLTAAPDSVAESADTAEITVTAMLGGTTTRSVATVVTVSVGGGTASSPADYAAVEDFTITIPAGQQSATGTFDFTPANDTIDEPAETVDVSGKAGTLTVNKDVVTITDDDNAPSAITLTADPDMVAEGDGKTEVTVTAMLGGTTTRSTATVVAVSVGGGTASSPADYAAVKAFTITIPAGASEAEGTFDFTPVDDKIDEPAETVDVTGKAGTLSVTGDVVTITDDDATPTAITLTAAPDSVAEGDGKTEVTVTAMLGGTTTSSTATVVTVSVGGGTATETADYAVVEDFTITIPAGNASATATFDFTPADDKIDEPNETVEVTGKAGTLTVTKDTITVTDDDATPTAITLTADPDTVAESAGETEITVTATLGGTTTSSTATEVTVSVGGGTASSPADYAAVKAFTITIPAGQQSATGTFDLTPADDKIDEPNETVDVTGVVTGGGFTVAKDVVTITDDDATPSAVTLTAAPDSVAESADTAEIAVTAVLGGTTTRSVATEVTVSVGGGTASSPADYAAVEDFTITIPAGNASATATFDFTPADDKIDEPNETVEVTGKAGTLTVTKDTITVTDDDATPTAITLTADPDTVAESAGETEITVTAMLGGSTTRSVATAVTVSVGGGTASSPADYAAVEAFTITIAAGTASATGTFDLIPVDDSVDEPAETVEVSGKAGTLSVTGDEITITDDDATPTAITLVAAPDSVGEGADKTEVTVTATLGGSTTRSVATEVTVSVGGGTATSVADYAAIEDFTITIPAGQKSATATFDLTPVDDSVDEPNETVEVSGKASGFTVTGDTITITDNDAAPTAITLTAAPDTVAEEGGKTKVTVTATLGGTTTSSTATAITVSVGGGTATSVADYAAVEAFTITIPAGQQSATGTFDFTPVDDSVDEPNETVEVTGKAGTLTVTGDVVTITDNDAAPTTVTLTADPDMVAESADKTSVTVTAMLGGSTTRSVATAVTVSVGGGTASSPADYAAVEAFTITIAAGTASATGTFDLIPVDDSVDEPAETVEVSGKAGTLSVTGDEITITDDDATPTAITLVAAPDSVGEGADKTEVTVTATLGGSTTRSVATEVTVSVGGGTATSVADYAAIEDFTITIPAGQKSATATFDLTPVDDSVDEPNETVEVSGKAGTLTVNKDTVTITDNDAAPTMVTLTAAPDMVAESADKTEITVTAALGGSTTSSTATAITVSVGGGTATSVADYAAVEGFTITIPAGASEAEGTFDFTPVDDSVDEPAETVDVTGVVTGGGLTVIKDTISITDDDAAPTAITLTADPDMVAEGDGKTEVTVTATLGGTTTSSTATEVTVSVGGGTASSPADYAAVEAFTITIPAGQQSATGTFDFTPVDDSIDEPAETVEVTGKAGTLSVTGDVVTITDDDAAPTAITLTADPDMVAEGDGKTSVTVTAMLGGTTTSSTATAVTVSVGGGTASSPADYTAVKDFTITIPAGIASATGTFDFTPVDDSIDEPAETVEVTGKAGTLTVTKDVITITDDDAAPTAITLTAAPDSVAESAGETEISVTAMLGGTTTSSTATEVTVSVGGGTASSPADYAAVEAFTITIPAGQQSATGTFDFTPVDDSIDEPAETVEVTGKAGTLTVNKDTVTITDDDATPSAVTLTAAPDSVAESAGETEVTVTATLGGTTTSSTATVVTVSVGGGTATSVADYAAVTDFTITIPAGQKSATNTFDFTPVDDSVDEPNETVEVTGAAGTLTVTKDVITITDDDAAPTAITLVAAPDSVGEGADKTEVTVTATLGGSTTRSVATEVTVSVGGGTATETDDYAAIEDFTITIPAGQKSTTVTFDFTPVDDSVDEPSETVEVSGTAGGFTVTGDEITITDDDATPSAVTLTAAPDTVAEEGGKKTVTVTATLGGTTTSSTATEVTVSVGGGTATAPADYAAVKAFTITIPAGAASATATFDFTPVDDSVDEPAETVEVSGKAGTLTVNKDTITITDNDAAPTAITLTADPDTVLEGAGETEITVTATLGGTTTSSTATEVTVSVRDGTATAGTDYAAVEDFTITIPAGIASATGTFDFTPVDDSVDEPNETVEVTGKSGTLTVTKDVITITDDDAAPTAITLTAAPDSVAESAGETEISVTATLGGTTTSSTATAVTVSVGGGTATAPADYAVVEDFTITIPAGQKSTTVTFDFTPVDDSVDEPSETVEVSGTAGGFTVTGDEITITDDDATPSAVTLTADPDMVAESAGETEITVTAMLGGSTTRSVATAVTVSVGGGTASSPADYAAIEDFTITIPAGQQSATGTFDFTPVDDSVDEPAETVDVMGKAGTLSVTGDVVTITDDDATPTAITLTADPDTVLEGAGKTEVTVTATLGGSTTRSVATEVTVSVGGGTAAETADYAAVEAFTITIPAGQKSATNTFDFIPVDDSVDEPSETVEVTGKAGTLTVTGDVVTITDDNAAPSAITLTADPDTVAESADKTEITVTATLGGTTTSSTATEVAVSVGGGTATETDDYAAVEDFTITIPAGQKSATSTFDFTPVDDSVDEPNETVEVSGKASGFTITGDTITITDDDAAPTAITLTAAPDTVAEEGGKKTVTVTATLGGSTTRSVATVVAVSVGGGTASSPADYAAVKDFTITIPAGAASATATFDLTPVNDSIDEPNETVEVTGKAGTLTITGDMVTITDNDAAPTAITLTAAPDSVAESADKTEITVTASLGGNTTRSTATVVAVSVGGGIASSPADYAAVEDFTITIAAGASEAEGTFDFTPVDDSVDEPNETVEVSGKASGFTVTGDTITITDDDAAPTAITLTADPDMVAEGDGKTSVTVTAMLGGSTTSSTATEVTVSVGGGTASSPADYAAVEAFTITIPAGQKSATATFDLTPVNDSIDEPNETVEVTGKAGTLTITGDTVTITDNDAAPTAITLTAAPDSVAESAGKTEITVTATLGGTTTRSTATEVTVSVRGGTATETADYAAVKGFTITIPAGQKSATGTFDLTPVDDSVNESDETIIVSGTASGLTVTGDEIAITDDDFPTSELKLGVDPPTTVTLSAAPDTVAESAGKIGITVTATLGGSTTSSTATEVTVSVGDSTATTGTDYAAVEAFTITIPAGAASATGTFDLTPVDDKVDEPAETVDVTGKAGTLTVTGDTVTIIDNDAAPTAITLTAAPDMVGEGGGETGITVTATLGGSTTSSTATVVAVSVGGGTAISPADYAAVEGFTITIPAGTASATGTFGLTPVDDSVDEPDEMIIVSGTASGLTVTGDEITITDDDATPTAITLTADPDMVGEGDGKTSVTVTATLGGSTTSSTATVVAVSVGGGTASSPADYAAVEAFTITIPAGASEAEGTFDLTPVDDSVDEPAETIIVSGTASGFTVTGDEIMIVDDDAAPVVVDVVLVSIGGAVSVVEGDDPLVYGRMVFSVGLSGVFGRDVVVDYGLGGSASVGVDYEAPDLLSVVVAAGDVSADVVLLVKGDVVDEFDETLVVTLVGVAAVPGDVVESVDVFVVPEGLVADVRGYAAEVGNGAAHVQRWKRVLVAFGEDVPGFSGTAMTVAEAEINAQTFWSVRWDPVVEALKELQKTQLQRDTAEMYEQDQMIDNVGGVVDVFVVPEGLVADVRGYAAEVGNGVAHVQRWNRVLVAFGEDVPGFEGAAMTVAEAEINAQTFWSVRWDPVVEALKELQKTQLQQDTATPYGQDQVLAEQQIMLSDTVVATGTIIDDDDPPPTPVVPPPAPVTPPPAPVSPLPLPVVVPVAPTLPVVVSPVEPDVPVVVVPEVQVGDATAVVEGDDPAVTVDMVFTVMLSTVASNDVIVAYTLGGSAVDGVDYETPNPLTVTIETGASTANIIIPVKGDRVYENNETVVITVTSVVNAALSQTVNAAIGIGEIIDDDNAPSTLTLSVSPGVVLENAGATAVTLTASLNGATTFPTNTTTTVSVGHTDDTAVSNIDYTTIADFTITIPAYSNSTTTMFTFTPIDDNFTEPEETLTIHGTNPKLTVTTTTTITIIDNNTQNPADITPPQNIAVATPTKTTTTPTIKELPKTGQQTHLPLHIALTLITTGLLLTTTTQLTTTNRRQNRTTNRS